MPRALESGRRRIVWRSLWTSALRWGIAAVAFASVVLSAAQVLAAGNVLPTAGGAVPSFVITSLCVALLAGALTGGIVGRRRGLQHWPRIWDRCLGLPNTVETCAAVVDRGNLGPWAEALLDRVAATPPPGHDVLRNALPLSLRGAFPLVILILSLQGLARAIPTSEEAPRQVPPTELLEAVVEFAKTNDADPNLVTVLQGFEGQDQELDWEALLDSVDRARTQARARADRRFQAAAVLEALAETNALAQWLITGVVPDALPKLSGSGQELVKRAVELLQDADPASAEFLSRYARGETDQAPAVDAASESWRLATALAELLRTGIEDGTANTIDERLAIGGSDRSQGPRASDESSSGSPTDNSDDAHSEGEIDIAPGSRIGEGETLPLEAAVATDLIGDPDWDRILANPVVEAHWVEVVDRYRKIEKKDLQE